jgi:hypothetical protein
MPTTTDSAMASEQPNFGAVGFNDGRLEQDEAMRGPGAVDRVDPRLIDAECTRCSRIVVVVVVLLHPCGYLQVDQTLACCTATMVSSHT